MPSTFHGRALVFYPWPIEYANGARFLFLNYARALKDAGLQLDCFVPAAGSRRPKALRGLFDRVFTDVPADFGPVFAAPDDLFANPMCQSLLSRADRRIVLTVATLAASGRYDLVAVNYTRYAPITRWLSHGVRSVLFTHDLDAIVARQEEHLFGVPADFTLADEVELMCRFDVVTVVGPDDAARVKSLAPDLRVIEAPFSPAMAPRARSRPRGGNLALISSSARFSDLSFRWFYRHVWPVIRARRPNTRLTIAGAISDLAIALGADREHGIEVKGMVDSIEPIYAAADVTLAPYYYGEGIKTKVIESLARGVPVVTTPAGLSNTRLIPGRHLLVASDAEAFASRVLELLEAPLMRETLAQAGLDYIRAFHSVDRALEPLRKVVAGWAVNGHAAFQPSTTATPRRIASSLRPLVRQITRRCASDAVRRVAFFGAGAHSRALLPIWTALGGPPVVSFVVSERPAQRQFLGLPLHSLSEFDGRTVDAVVLSSQTHEAAMAAALRRAWPDVRCYSIWSAYDGVREEKGNARDENLSKGRPEVTARLPRFPDTHDDRNAASALKVAAAR